MKKMRKLIALVVAMVMLVGLMALSASAEEPGTIRVRLRIEGVKEMLFYENGIEIGAGSTVEDLMMQINEAYDALGIVITVASWGDTYVSEIAGLTEFDYGGLSGWSFRVNGVAPTVGQSLVFLEDLDSVVFYYGDPWGAPGMQYPFEDMSRLYSDGVIGIYSNDEEYDEDWNPTVVTNPVAGATVTLAGAVYTTDENGEIKITDKSGLAGFKTLQVERYDKETGVPTVLRLWPYDDIYIPFADTPFDEWYEGAVMFCVGDGLFVGTNTTENLFSPLTNMTMAQLVTVLGRLAGENFNSDPPSVPWYASARAWAIEHGVISEEAFVFDENVTRERFVDMFYYTASLIGTYDMTLRADITGAVDYDEINEDYREAVSWAVATGIIRGTGTGALTISPAFEVNRVTACQMLLDYYSE